MGCPSGVCVIVVGVAVTFIGFAMAMYGNFHKPFWSVEAARRCDFCKEDRETTLRNTRNTRIAGPIVIVIGVFIIVVGVVQRRRAASLAASEATNYANYSTSSYPTNSSAPVGGSYVQPGPGVYPTSGPTGQVTYPPPQYGGYQQNYPPPGPKQTPAAYSTTGTFVQTPGVYPPPQAPHPYPPTYTTENAYSQQYDPSGKMSAPMPPPPSYSEAVTPSYHQSSAPSAPSAPPQ